MMGHSFAIATFHNLTHIRDVHGIVFRVGNSSIVAEQMDKVVKFGHLAANPNISMPEIHVSLLPLPCKLRRAWAFFALDTPM